MIVMPLSRSSSSGLLLLDARRQCAEIMKIALEILLDVLGGSGDPGEFMLATVSP